MSTASRFAICALLACVPWATVRAQCVVRSSGELSRVRVEVEGGEPIELVALGATEAEIRPLEGERARVRVLRPLRYEGTIDTREIVFLPARDLVLEQGAIGIDDVVELHGVKLEPRGAVFDLALPGGVAVDVRVPCASLSLHSAEDARTGRRTAGSAPAVTRVATLAPTVTSFVVRARPGGPPVVTVRVTDREQMQLAELRREGESVEVMLTNGTATYVRGWVDASALTPVAERARGDSFGFGGLGSGCGRGGSGSRYRGPATLLGGARVHASRGGPMWAHAAEEVALDWIVIEGDGEWAQVERMAHVRQLGVECASVMEAFWVRVSELRIP